MEEKYIGYIQTESLLKSWSTIQGIKESLQLELQAIGTETSLDEEDDSIYTQVVGNKILSDIPPSGKISDTTGNTSQTYKQVMKRDYFNTLEEIQEESFCINLVDDKLNVAFRRLSVVEKNILSSFYLEKKTWSEVLEELKKERCFITKHQAQLQRRKAIDKVQTVSKITTDMYLFVMKLVGGE